MVGMGQPQNKRFLAVGHRFYFNRDVDFAASVRAAGIADKPPTADNRYRLGPGNDRTAHVVRHSRHVCRFQVSATVLEILTSSDSDRGRCRSHPQKTSPARLL